MGFHLLFHRKLMIFI